MFSISTVMIYNDHLTDIGQPIWHYSTEYLLSLNFGSNW